jgi:type I site-specific restriction endonuclease
VEERAIGGLNEGMRYYNEADTRAKLIDPKVKLAGWGERACMVEKDGV